jgi:hypothetical protein
LRGIAFINPQYFVTGDFIDTKGSNKMSRM